MEKKSYLQKWTSGICATINLMIAVIFAVGEKSIELFVYQAVLAGAIYFMLFHCIKQVHIHITLFFAVWVTGYSFIYIFLKMGEKINLYDIPYRIPLQLVIPFLVAIILKRIDAVKDAEG